MRRDEIKEIIEGITKDQLDQIMSINGMDIEKAKSDLATYKEKAENLSSQLANRDKQLKELKESDKDNEKLQAKIAELQTANETSKTEYEAKITALEHDKDVELRLRDAKAKNVRAVKALLGEGDLDEQIKQLREAEDTAFLFEAKKQESTQPTPPRGTSPQNGEQTPPTSKTTSLSEAIGKAFNTKG